MGCCRLVSRNDYTFPHRPGLSQWIADNLLAKSAVLDGELACLDDSGRSQFYDLFFRRREPVYYAFDLLCWEGADLRNRPLVERKESLKAQLPAEPTQISLRRSRGGEGRRALSQGL